MSAARGRAKTGSPALDGLLEKRRDRAQRQTIAAVCETAGIVPLQRPGETPRRAYFCDACAKAGFPRRLFVAPGDPIPVCRRGHPERRMVPI